MPEPRVELPGSDRQIVSAMRLIERVPSEQSITVSVYLKAKGSPPSPIVARETMRMQRELEHADDLAAIAAFAKAADLTLVEQDAARRLIRLSGSAQALEQAFGTSLHHYKMPDGTTCRARSGSLHLPSNIVDCVVAVLGLETTPVATPKFVPHRGANPPAGFLPTQVAALYGFEAADAGGQCIAIIELGGGYTAADNATAFKAMGLPVPEIVAVAVDGGSNDPGDTSGANGEVALDIQVAGGVACGAKLAVYFASNTNQGFADAISQAVHDETNKPVAISISWGSAEAGWTGQAITAMHQAFEDAASLGVTVCAASGDSLATDGESDGKAHVDYPASDPLVVGCGGTRITASSDGITTEVVWKSNGGGTGGGVSDLFAKPDYQSAIDVPAPSAKAGGRGVPDVAGNADPDSGYRIVTGGQTGIIGGTSAVAPLWAAIAAVLTARKGSALGDPHAAIYAAKQGFRDITQGDNKSGDIGFSAGPGWDACTGLGSPDGAPLSATLA